MVDETNLTSLLDDRVKVRIDQTDEASGHVSTVELALLEESESLSRIRLAYSRARLLDAVRGMLVLTYALCLFGIVLATVLRWIGVM